MNNRETMELAAFVATHAHRVIQSRTPPPKPAIARFWLASRRRHHAWTRILARYTWQIHHADIRALQLVWPQVRPVLEEIFTAEALTRVWSATLTAFDRRRPRDELLEPIAQNVMVGQLEAQRLALNLLLRESWTPPEEPSAVQGFRRRTERWTDLLLAPLIARYDVCQFACDPRRAGEFSEEFLVADSDHCDNRIWPLTMVSLRLAFRRSDGAAPSRHLNDEVGRAILCCFPPDVLPFDQPFSPIRRGYDAKPAERSDRFVGRLGHSGRLGYGPTWRRAWPTEN